ncbi:MAG: PD-(D/E)XK nuclease family protein [Ignavibacteriae bacterium]|nr:PD-(D/E)XK nuclease family protein [Ignavibacteriota bacterium]
MSKSYLIAPSVNLVHQVLEHLCSEGSDYSANLVVFPGKRPGYFLRKAIAERERKSFIPPTILSMDEFIEFLYKGKLQIHKPTIEVLDAVSILFELHKQSANRFGNEHFRSLDDFLPLGIKLFAELEELTIAQCLPNQAREVVGAISYGKLHTIPDLYEKFYTELKREGFTSRSLKYKEVAAAFNPNAVDEFSRVIVAGFFALTNSEKLLFRRLTNLEQVTFLFQRGPRIQLLLHDLDLKPEELGDRPSVPRISFYRSPDLHGQVFALTAMINERLQQGESVDETTAIVLPSANALFPVLHHTLSLLKDVQYNISMGYNLSRTPVYSFYRQFLKLITSMHENTFHAPEYIKFVLHPYTKNVLFRKRADVTRILFHAIEKHFVDTKLMTFFSLEELESQHELFQRVVDATAEPVTQDDIRLHLRRIHDKTIRKMLEVQNIKDFALKSIEVLNFMYDESTARFHPYFHPFAEKLIETLNALSRGIIGEQRFDDYVSYVKFIQHYLASVEAHFAGMPLGGLQTLGFLETRNLKFKRVYVLDVNDDVIPGKTNGTDMLLPQQVREKLGLETLHDRERLAEYYLNTLLHGAEEVHVFFTEDGTREKSRFVEKLLWEKQRRDRRTDTDFYIKSVSYKLSLKNQKPESIAKTTKIVDYLRSMRYNATALDTYLKCPLQFYYAHVLRLRERDEVSGDVEQRDIGTLVHDILKEYFQPYVERVLQEQDMQSSNLKNILDKLVRVRFGEQEFGNLTLMNMQIEKQLQEFLRKYQAPLVRSSEITIEGVEVELQTESRGFRFGARCDRIERRGEMIYILDYKTGSDISTVKVQKLDPEDKKTWNKAIGSFQLPLYAYLYAKSHGRSIEQIMPAYIHLGNNRMDEKIEVPLFEEIESKVDKYVLIEQVLFRLLEEIVDTEVPFTPTTELEKHCPTCPYKTICGTQWVKSYSEP